MTIEKLSQRGYFSIFKAAMMDVVTKVCKRILDVWSAAGSRGSWVTICFFAAMIAICGGTALIGAVPTFVSGRDNFLFLENGWRALYGLRPNLDFWSPWGPLNFLAVALGLKLSHASVNGLAYATAIFALVVGLWAYRLGRGRLAQVPRALLALYVTALACAPYPIGYWVTLLSPAMLYNRWGYALLILVLLECFQRLEETRPSIDEWQGALSTGAALALALFLKPSYFFAGLGLIVASLILWIPSLRRLLGILAGFAVVAFFAVAYLRFDVHAILHGLTVAAGARAQSLSPKTPIWAITSELGPLYGVLALALAASFQKPRQSEWLGQLHLPLAALVVYVADVALLSTNAQPSGLPLLGAFAVLVANRLADFPNRTTTFMNGFTIPYYASVLLLSGFLFLPQLTGDILALPVAALRKFRPPPECSMRFTEPRLAGLILCDGGTPDNEAVSKWANGSAYTTYVNDGIALLRREAAPTDKVLTMDAQSPFPYALGWPPPRGGLASTSFNRTLSAQFRPSFDEYFGDATVVMAPKHPALSPMYFDGFYEIYEPAMEERFRLEAESDWFRLYKLK